MKKVGILYICTGKYTVFWPEFYLSAEHHFLRNSEVHYYVFTDAAEIEYQRENERIHVIHQEAYGWPFSTLMRFSVFLSAKEQLRECDYVFFFNANAQFIAPIEEERFLPDQEEGKRLLVVQHPGFYNQKSYRFTYDRNPRCSAYIPYSKGKVYVCGGVNGGRTEAFLDMCQILSDRINKDLESNIIPEWHDESQLNQFILDREDVKVLSPAYCFPENWNIPFEGKVLIRDKRNYINIGQIRKDAPETKLSFVQRVVNAVSKATAILLTWLRDILNIQHDGVTIYE